MCVSGQINERGLIQRMNESRMNIRDRGQQSKASTTESGVHARSDGLLYHDRRYSDGLVSGGRCGEQDRAAHIMSIQQHRTHTGSAHTEGSDSANA